MYHRQVSSSPRSVPATRSSTAAGARRRPRATRLSIAGRDRLAGQRRRCAGSGSSAVSAPSRDPVGAAEREAVVEDADSSLPDDAATTNGAHSQPGVRRVGVERARSGRTSSLADPGAAAAPAEDRLAVVGVAGAGAPVGVDHQVGHRGRRQDRVVAAGRQVDPALAPAEPLRELGRRSRAASTSAKSRVAPPTQALLVRSAVLPVQP